MRHSFKGLPIGPALAGYRTKSIDRINSRRSELHVVSDDELKALARNAHTLPESFAVTAILAERILGFKMFDVQLRCALALADGKIAEMQTGEGKTLSAVPTVVWLARAGKGVHVIILGCLCGVYAYAAQGSTPQVDCGEVFVQWHRRLPGWLCCLRIQRPVRHCWFRGIACFFGTAMANPV